MDQERPALRGFFYAKQKVVPVSNAKHVASAAKATLAMLLLPRWRRGSTCSTMCAICRTIGCIRPRKRPIAAGHVPAGLALVLTLLLEVGGLWEPLRSVPALVGSVWPCADSARVHLLAQAHGDHRRVCAGVGVCAASSQRRAGPVSRHLAVALYRDVLGALFWGCASVGTSCRCSRKTPVATARACRTIRRSCSIR